MVCSAGSLNHDLEAKLANCRTTAIYARPAGLWARYSPFFGFYGCSEVAYAITLPVLMGRFPKLPKSLYFSGIVTAHPRSSAKVSRESVEHGDCAEHGAPALLATSTNAGKMATGRTAALVQIFARTVKGMPKWVVYCGQCNRPSTYNQIDDSTIDLAAPAAKKPPLPVKGEGWECPLCKRKSQVRDCDLTYSHA